MTTKLPNGRPPDPETQAEAQALAERYVAKRAKRYLEELDRIALSDDTPPDQKRMAIMALFERGLGKAAVPDRDDQLGKLAEVLKQVAKISSNNSNARVIEVRTRRTDAGSEDGSDPGRSLPTPSEESSVDYSETAGDS